jgi:hypothetical protein
MIGSYYTPMAYRDVKASQTKKIIYKKPKPPAATGGFDYIRRIKKEDINLHYICCVHT